MEVTKKALTKFISAALDCDKKDFYNLKLNQVDENPTKIDRWSRAWVCSIA